MEGGGTAVNYVLNDAGEPVIEPDSQRWSQWMLSNVARRRLAVDYVGSVMVSTWFIGRSYTLLPDTPPALWETCVDRPDEVEIVSQYMTREGALLGHARQLADVLRLHALAGHRLRQDSAGR